MPVMTRLCVGVAVVNGVLVADGSSGLYHGVDSGLMGYLDAVGEGEEGVGAMTAP